MADSADRATVWSTAFRSSFGQGQHSALKLEGVHSPVRVPLEVVDDLARSAKALERLGIWMLSSCLRQVEGVTHHQPNLLRKRLQVLPIQMSGLTEDTITAFSMPVLE